MLIGLCYTYNSLKFLNLFSTKIVPQDISEAGKPSVYTASRLSVYYSNSSHLYDIKILLYLFHIFLSTYFAYYFYYLKASENFRSKIEAVETRWRLGNKHYTGCNSFSNSSTCSRVRLEYNAISSGDNFPASIILKADCLFPCSIPCSYFS